MVRVYVFELAGERWPVVWQGRQPPRDSLRCTWRLVARVSGRAEADRLVAELYEALRSSRRARVARCRAGSSR